MKGTKTRRLLLTLGIVVLVAAAGITAVFAQKAEEEPLPGADAEATAEAGTEAAAPFGFHGHQFGAKRGSGIPGKSDFAFGGRYGGALEGITPWGQGLADALEIPLEELEEAQVAAYANWLAEMVAAGYLEQEQADLMLAYSALKGNINRAALTAGVLGMNEDALTAAREEGKTLAQILEDAGLSIEEFISAMQEAYEAAVQAEVGESITQAQADLILENGAGFAGMRGNRMGHGRGMNRGHGMNRGSSLSRRFSPGIQGSSFGPALTGTEL